MNFVYSAQVRTLIRLASALCACACVLTGCSDSAHDPNENAPPTSLPPASLSLPTDTKTSTKAAPKKTEQTATTSVPAPTEADLGMPVYPNAKTYIDAAGKPVPPLTDGGMATATLETQDSVDKVVAFYADRITEADSRGTAKSAKPREEVQDGKRKVVLIGNDVQHNVQMAEIREGDGKTIIELIHAQAKSLPSGVPGGTGSSPEPGTAAPSGSGASSSLPAPSSALPSGDTLGHSDSGSGGLSGSPSRTMSRPPSKVP